MFPNINDEKDTWVEETADELASLNELMAKQNLAPHILNMRTTEEVVFLRLNPSLEGVATLAATAAFLDTLHRKRSPQIKFSLVGDGNGPEVYLLLACRKAFAPTLEQLLRGHFPKMNIEQLGSDEEEMPECQERAFYKTSTLFPIARFQAFDVDPYTAFFSICEGLRQGEVLRLKIFLKATNDPWTVGMGRACGVEGKQCEGLCWVVKIVLEASAPKTERAKELVASVEREMFVQFLNGDRIEPQDLPPKYVTGASASFAADETLYLLATSFYEQGRIFRFTARLRDDVARYYAECRDVGKVVWFLNHPEDRVLSHENILTTNELVGLVHMPSKAVCSTLLARIVRLDKVVPELLTHDGIVLGSAEYRRAVSRVALSESVRDRHIYVIGKTRMGKSTLLLNMARQDIEAGRGVGVIDPHGDLVEDLLGFIPRSRVTDTIYFDGKNRDAPLGLNVLTASSDDEAELIADDFLVTFRRLSESWGERMDTILRHTVHALAKYKNATFFDIRSMLLKDSFRQKVVREARLSPLAAEYWSDEFPNLPKEASAPILARMGKFVLSSALTGILGQSQGGLDLYDVMQNRKILLVNLGGLGGDNGNLLGSLIVSQIQLAAMRRATLPKEARLPFYLYLDEFQNFTTSAFQKILSEASKYKLCLTLAHQYVSQLEASVKDAVLGNVGTMVMFKLGEPDARALRGELGDFEPEHAMDLTPYECLCRPATGRRDTFRFKTLPAPLQWSTTQSHAKEIKEYTKRTYSSVPLPAGEPQKEPDAQSVEPEPKVPVAIKNTANLPVRERILHYVKMAAYLSQRQIMELCYAHMTPASAKSAASRDLKSLVEEKLLYVQYFGREKVYHVARSVAPSQHNIGVRDLFVKIMRSEYEIGEINFALALDAVLPDLYVGFLSADGTLVKTVWEYDTGTEGMAEIVSKLTRYKAHPEYRPVICIVQDQKRLQLVQQSAPYSSLWLAIMADFQSLKDPVFVRADKNERGSLFVSF